MTSRDSGGQQRANRRSEDEAQTTESAETEGTERNEKLSEDVDAMLDEIDGVLEENAEEFVRSYVQKGGQ